ncbi:hypothetical protein CKJ85_04070 [Corynebacterium sp. NML 150383]|nr:hypothetical protein CKJ85_04070 [Corynebacterium sp. NML 150383]
MVRHTLMRCVVTPSSAASRGGDDDLLELIIEQTAYLTHHIDKRVNTSPPRAEARHNSTVICALLAQQGVNVTLELLRKWAERGKITATH